MINKLKEIIEADRINRKEFWISTLVYFLLVAVFSYLTGLEMEGVVGSAFNLPFWFLAFKRWKDRNRKWWLFLFVLIPIVNIWIYFECFFLKGRE